MSCTCDPAQPSINDPACPTHGAEVRAWQAWHRGEARCPYCIGLDDRDWLATCDCFMAENELARIA